MRRSGLEEARYPLRASGARVFYVSGPPNYVDHVLRLAQLMDRQRAELRLGPQRIGVVQVLNTHVADREYNMGDRTVTVPGMASMIEKLLAVEQESASPRQPGLLADKNISVLAYPDTNSLLIKGKPAQVSFIEGLVAELDVPKRAVEVSMWLVDVDRDELKKIGATMHKGGGQAFSYPGHGTHRGRSIHAADHRLGVAQASESHDVAGDSHPGECARGFQRQPDVLSAPAG